MDPNELRQDFNDVVTDVGLPCTITVYRTTTFSSTGYDDEQLVSASGTTTSGACFLLPIGPSDRQYLERGSFESAEAKLYLAGSLNISGNSVITVGNTGSLYEVLPKGIWKYDVSGTTVYQVAYVQKIISGQHAGIT